ncbi:hypothetical protein HD596_011299 [Nonomuraea jabiensis]|uniref:Uncharacterized protein n=1 Tax=Nonomuraea jabiensis TaxID=882448 RepID=A0A7W9LI39_9ACTN|nr:hypothetical protein [Nonomuraea jabiensis]
MAEQGPDAARYWRIRIVLEVLKTGFWLLFYAALWNG